MRLSRYHLAVIGLVLVALTFLASCEINKLNSAQDHFDNQRYASAIQEIDSYVRNGKNGALITRAELLRSASYYELGLIAKQRENWDLAIRFFKLSNSGEADEALGSIYKTLADEALAAGKLRESLDYVNAILREVKPERENELQDLNEIALSEQILTWTQSLRAEMLYRRIGFELDTFIDHAAAWRDYMDLYDNYPNNPYKIAASRQIQRIVPNKVEYARKLYTTGYYIEGLNILRELGRYPVVDEQVNDRMIAEAYIGQAESFLKEQDYLQAHEVFRIAVQYDPSKKAEIDRRLDQVINLFIQKGNELVSQRDFDNALILYQRTFDIVPDYPAAVQAIARLNTIRENIARATDLYAQAVKAESSGRYSEAMSLYREANNLDNRTEYSSKAAQMQNLIEAERNPTGFAQQIINDFKGGLLNSRIRKQKQELLRSYNASEIRDSGWKITVSSGQYKYEARYDLITPTVSYYYVWQVSLKDRQIVPLNKLSENLMR